MTKQIVVGISKVKHIIDKVEINKSIFKLLDEMKQKNIIDMKKNAVVMIKPNICMVKGYETAQQSILLL